MTSINSANALDLVMAQPETDRRHPGQGLLLRRGAAVLFLSPDVVDRTEAYQTPAPVPFMPAGVAGIVVMDDGEICTVLDPAAFGGASTDSAQDDGPAVPTLAGSSDCLPVHVPARLMVRLVTGHGPVVVLCDQLTFGEGDEALGLAMIAQILAPLVPAAVRRGIAASAVCESHSDYLIIGKEGVLAAVSAANVIAVDRPHSIRQSWRSGELVAEVGGQLLPCRCLEEGMGNDGENDGKAWALTVDDAGVRRVLLTTRVEGLHRVSSEDVLTVDHGGDRGRRYSRWVRHPRFGLVEIVAATRNAEADDDNAAALFDEAGRGVPAFPTAIPSPEAVPQAAFSLRVGNIIIAAPAAVVAGALRAEEIGPVSTGVASGAPEGSLFDLAAALASVVPEAGSDGNSRGHPRPGILIPMGKHLAVVRVDEVRLSSSTSPWCLLPILPAAAAAVFAAVRLCDGQVEYLLKPWSSDFCFNLPVLRRALRRGFVGRVALPSRPDGNHRSA